MEHLCLNAIRKPSQAIVEFRIDGCWGILAVSGVLGGEGVKYERSVGVIAREVWWWIGWKRSEMKGDGAPVMETIGQTPGICEKLFGLRGNSESELVGASEEWLGRRHGFFPDQSSEKSRMDAKDVRRKAAFGPGGSRGTSWVDVGKVVGDWVLLWLVSSAPSGYGEDGVHSREAAEKKHRRQKRFCEKFMKEKGVLGAWKPL